jgi:MSHA pilin protein MshB
MHASCSSSHALRPAPGLTLLELVLVIALIGIISVMALPRLLDLREEAHQSSAGATAASFEAAVILANTTCLYEEHEGLDNLASFGAGNVDFNANCFPSSTNGRNDLTVNANRCLQIWNGILFPAPSISTLASDDTDYRAQGSGTICRYTYRRDASVVRRFTYNAATGEIVVTNP